MNSVVATKKDGTKVLVLALEPANIHRLKTFGEPIQLRIEDLFPDGIPKRLALQIRYSETPFSDARELGKHAEVMLNERGAPKRPHCPECKSTIEQIGVWRNESPLALVFCPTCGCIFGTAGAKDLPAQAREEKEKVHE